MTLDHPVASSLLPVVLLIGIGFAAGRLKLIRGEAVRDLSNLVFLVLVQALLFRTMATADLARLDLRSVALYDIVAGAIVGSSQRIKHLTHLMNHLGGSLDPHACFLLHRGLKTLGVRVRHQSNSALAVAKALEAHPRVARVHYPGLKSSPYHANAKKQLGGQFGAMLSFELKDEAQADAWMNACHLPVNAASLGGVESLVTRPVTTSHSGLTREERAAAGIAEGLIRVSIGLEDPQDLIEDFQAAFQVDKRAVSV